MLEILFAGVGQRSYVEEELVPVRSAVVEGERLRWRRWLALPLSESLVETETVGQHKRAIVIGIVTHIVVGHRRLRRDGHKCRMRVDHAGGGVEAGLRDAPHADFAA